MIQIAVWLGVFGLAMLYMSIGISSAGEAEAKMLKEWRRIGWGLLAAAAIALALAVTGAR